MNSLKVIVYAYLALSLNAVVFASEHKKNDEEHNELQRLFDEAGDDFLNTTDPGKKMKLVFDPKLQEELLNQAIEQGDVKKSKEILFYSKIYKEHEKMKEKATRDVQEKLDACYESSKNNVFWKGIAVATAACSGCYIVCQLVWYLAGKFKGKTT
jgi:hypothetical protein